MKNVINKVIIIARYLFGGFMICGGLIEFSANPGFAIVCFAFGISLFPVIYGKFFAKYISDEKLLFALQFVIPIVLFLIFSSSIPENTSTSKSNSTSKTSKRIVEVIDFSSMAEEEIKTWCENNNVICSLKKEYSTTIAEGKFVEQSVAVGGTIEEGSIIYITYSRGKEPTKSQQNALRTAHQYLRTMPFSYKGLVEQLEYEKYSHDDAVYAADNCGADWNEQAKKDAAAYLKIMGFSHDGLVEQLEFEGYTHEQAEYGVSANGL